MGELGVFGIGIATADAELRTVGEKGASVCSVNLAFNRSYKDKNDEWQQEPCFVRAQVWGARAERMAESVKKGQPVYVCGHLKQDSWEKDGQKRVSYSINLRSFELCVRNGKSKSKGKGKDEPKKVEAAAEVKPEVEDNEDIPF
ncbi:hypothetical protein LCGC14_2509300 [marine sediment metagenome]|uniref:Single-stranded DNA-binding protein n=1 Tax=marine sediment metagenome TaxID=412755 RepID=A0A0F9AZL0_9ZZZZ